MIKGVVETSTEKSFELTRIAIVDSVVDEGVKKSTFSLEVKSPFLALAQFLDTLEQSAEWISIGSVNITRMEKELMECEGSIKINTYEVVGGDR